MAKRYRKKTALSRSVVKTQLQQRMPTMAASADTYPAGKGALPRPISVLVPVFSLERTRLPHTGFAFTRLPFASFLHALPCRGTSQALLSLITPFLHPCATHMLHVPQFTGVLLALGLPGKHTQRTDECGSGLKINVRRAPK